MSNVKASKLKASRKCATLLKGQTGKIIKEGKHTQFKG